MKMFSRIFNSTPYVATTVVSTSVGVFFGMLDGIENSVQRNYDRIESFEEVVMKTTIGGVTGFCWPISGPLIVIRNRMKKD